MRLFQWYGQAAGLLTGAQNKQYDRGKGFIGIIRFYVERLGCGTPVRNHKWFENAL